MNIVENVKIKIKNLLRDYLSLDVKKHNPAHWEPSQISYLLKEFQVTRVVDVGASVGQYSQKMRDIGFKGSIHSFEPIKSCYEKMKNLFINDPNINCYHTALGDFDGESILNISNNIQSSSILKTVDNVPVYEDMVSAVGTETIKVQKLDTIFNGQLDGINFLKIDVQGFEMQVLQGAKNTLNSIDIIQIETSLSSLYDNGSLLDEVITFLRTYEFIPYNFIKGVFNNKSGQLYELDIFFVKKSRLTNA
jgi:FkbM family methyltransferase